MNISYDPKVDAIYIQLRDAAIDDTIEAGRYIFVDVDADGVPVGVELLFAGRAWTVPDAAGLTVNIALPDAASRPGTAA